MAIGKEEYENEAARRFAQQTMGAGILLNSGMRPGSSPAKPSADSPSIPQEALDQIFQEITEAGTVASPYGKTEESSSSIGAGSPQQAADSQAVAPGAEGEEAAQDDVDTGQR